jgi:hypothetical protein
MEIDMSRTDKDLPLRIRQEPYKNPDPAGFWSVSGPYSRGWRNYTFWYVPHPPAWFVEHVWNGPERRRARDIGREAIKDYRANGDTDIDFPRDHHRHCARWLWW